MCKQLTNDTANVSDVNSAIKLARMISYTSILADIKWEEKICITYGFFPNVQRSFNESPNGNINPTEGIVH